MPESDHEREARADELAYKRGQREAYVNAELESHEKRLNAINGSIERHAKGTHELRLSIDRLGRQVAEISNQIATKAAIEESRAQELKRANEQQISTRTFWLGVAAIVATLAAAVLVTVAH